MARLYIGMSGFQYGEMNRKLYPEYIKKDELLGYYATRFKTVEINTTFYGAPRQTSLETWKSSVGEDFVFSFKAPRVITHVPDFNFDDDDLRRFINSMIAFSDGRHIILFQLPETTAKNLFQLKKLLGHLPNGFKYAFEFRSYRWFSHDVYAELERHNASIVTSDNPKGSSGSYVWPRKNRETADFSYFRMHGSETLYTSSYDEGELRKYAALVRDKLKRGKDVFVYFNNNREGHGILNARSFIAMFPDLAYLTTGRQIYSKSGSYLFDKGA